MTTLSTEVLVIGGGATGAGVAWDAALRGFDVVLVDRQDLAEGTSGRFHGLLHSVRGRAPDCLEDPGGLFCTTPGDDPAYADRFAQGCADTGVDCEEISSAEV